MQLHVAVCDNEPLDCQKNAALVREILQNKGISFVVSFYANRAELLDAIYIGDCLYLAVGQEEWKEVL